MTKISLLAAAALLAVSASAASAKVLEVVTDPPGAACKVIQNSATADFLEETPGLVKVTVAAAGLRVECELAGFRKAVFEIGDPDAFGVDRRNGLELYNYKKTGARIRSMDRIFLEMLPR